MSVQSPVANGTKLATRAINTDEQVQQIGLVDSAGVDPVGDVGASPAANTLLGRLKAIADGITALSGYVDGLETLATSLNGYVDTLEALIGTTNTSLLSLAGYVDGLESLATSLNGYVDGLEGLQGTANTSLATLSSLITTLNTYVDGLEASLAGVLTEATFTARTPTLGQKAKSGSRAVTLASDDDLLAAFGTPVASPAANTLLDRLKALLTGIILAAGENHVGAIGGHTAVVSDTFTRPADVTAYASGDLVANNPTAASVTALAFVGAARIAGGSGMIRRARLRKSGTGVNSAQFRLHLFNAALGTPTNGDNGAFAVPGVANYIGAIDVNTDQAFNDGAWGAGLSRLGSEINFKLLSGTTIYGLIEARAAYTPANAETFTVALEIVQD
jgi:hypothetical protein